MLSARSKVLGAEMLRIERPRQCNVPFVDQPEMFRLSSLVSHPNGPNADEISGPVFRSTISRN